MVTWVQFHIPKHCIELSLADAKPIYSALYQAGPKARKFKRNRIDKMLPGELIVSFQTK